MATVLKYRFAMRRRVAADWTSVNEVLLNSEWGYETDTGKLKIGNGTDTWTGLPYLNTSNIPEAAGSLYFNGLRVNQALAAGDGIQITYASGVSTITLAGLPIYLIDESTNQLTDENGNFLVDTAVTSLPVPFDIITDLPTDLAGYGITDAQKIGDPVLLQKYVFASKPSAATWDGGIIIITDLSVGQAPCWSDGTDWRLMSDNTIATT